MRVKVRQRFVDSPTSLGGKRRLKRWEALAGAFPDFDQMRVLDLGGTADAWMAAPLRPREAVVLNLFEPGESHEPWLRTYPGDACRARAELDQLGQDEPFDVVFSNSVIEHVGGHAKRVDFAREVRSLAPYHWVQTPYRYFPVEPHFVCPGLQFLPMRSRMAVAAVWPLCHTRPANSQAALEEMQWTELLSLTEMRAYFPESELYLERMGGLVKSVTAVRAPSSPVDA
jgi:hypothetical protein